uniref:Ig-like domain-containing protein n=1 Tax=Xiphophorus maculatus TaxID=8083 RepID=M4AZC4_XIPMA
KSFKLCILFTKLYLLSQLGPPEPSTAPPEIMDVTKSSVALAWSRPKDDGGSAINGYFVEYKEVSTETWIRHETKITSTIHAVVNEGDNVKFICNIENYDSTTEVTWYCGVRQLEAGDKYEIEYEDGLAVITINKITRADDGTYRCKVVNEYGEDSAYAELFVSGVRSYLDTARLLQKPPEFTLPLVNRTAYLGEDVRFGVTITVHPEPRVIWHKSGQKLIPGHDDRKYTFTTDKGLYQLIIHNLEKEDDAEYSVVARNRYGDDSCKARLTVVARPKPADLTLRPMFKRLLANIECKEGQNVRFEIRVSGHPTLKWEKDGTPLAFGPSIEVVHEDQSMISLTDII